MKAFNPKWLLLTLIGIAAIILVGLFISGFFKSEETIIKEAKKAAKSSLQIDDLSLNKELENVSMYLPESMEVLSSSPNNILLESDGEKKYILFYNPLEKKTSQMYFKSAKEDDNIQFIDSFEQDGVFGYMKVVEIDEESYELQIGAGGVKMTTETDLNHMKDDAREMMKVAHSIVYSTSN